MHTLQFDTQTEQALNRLATRAGKDTNEFIKDVVSEFLEEQADVEAANAAYDSYLSGQGKTVSLDELERALGLES